MSRCLVCPDESEFQPPISRQFDRRMVILRVAFGAHYADQKFATSRVVLDWLYAHRIIDGAVLYQVYLSSATPQEHYAFAWGLIGKTVPPWLMGVMLDVEAWSGTSYPVRGDHSRQVNALGALHAHKLGSWRAVWLYGNRNDLASIVPKRDARFPVIVASYGPQLVYGQVKGAIGQQYTDGLAKWGLPKLFGKVLPRSTAGVQCDHNVFDPARFPSAAVLRAWMYPAARPAPAPKPPVVVKPKPPVTPPVVKPAGPHYKHAVLHAHDDALVAPRGAWAWLLLDDGRVSVRHNGRHVRYL
jgi:hypothetical protein